ncbi:unnamed protein product [Didymodactylos carnosus]|uniref:catechol O-methyltransferase n=1 Tax=Didymodactylos carnosus TaxID=1234261 RepID=A0A8S2ET81_9BILA|nr:unnamed protein product [Didymodactylos carnosus]CAF4041862.1 unnamed protein product [Didymodactylos carnosus]
MMHVGEVKGEILEKQVKNQRPKTVLELGTYYGYSALRIASHLPKDALFITVEISKEAAKIAYEILKQAGISDRVHIVVGSTESVIPQIKDYHSISLSVNSYGKMNISKSNTNFLLNIFQHIPSSHVALSLRLIRLYPVNIVNDSMKREQPILAIVNETTSNDCKADIWPEIMAVSRIPELAEPVLLTNEHERLQLAIEKLQNRHELQPHLQGCQCQANDQCMLNFVFDTHMKAHRLADMLTLVRALEQSEGESLLVFVDPPANGGNWRRRVLYLALLFAQKTWLFTTVSTLGNRPPATPRTIVFAKTRASSAYMDEFNLIYFYDSGILIENRV